MAYAFNNLLSLTDENGPNQNNIFNGGTENAPGPDTQGTATTSTGGGAIDASSGGSSQSQVTSAKPESKPVTNSAFQQIAQKNQSKTPDFVGSIKSGVDDSQKKIQQEADSYVQANQPQVARTDYRTDVKKAAKGNDTYKQQLQDTVSKGPATTKDFESSVDTDFGDVGLLQNKSGISDLLMKNIGGGEYGKRLARFDAGLLSGSRDFADQATAANKAAEDARALQDKFTGGIGESDIERAAREGDQRRIDLEKAAALAAAKEYGQGITGSLQSKANQRNSAIDALTKKNVAQYLAEQTGGSKAKGIDAKDFYKSDEGNYDLNDFVGQNEASQLANLDAILQLGGDTGFNLNQSLNIPKGAVQSFDKKAYDQSVMEAAIKKIVGSSNKTAEKLGGNKGLKTAVKTAKEEVNKDKYGIKKYLNKEYI